MPVGIIHRLKVIQIDHIEGAAFTAFQPFFHIIFKAAPVIKSCHQILFRKASVVIHRLFLRLRQHFRSSCSLVRPSGRLPAAVLLGNGYMNMYNPVRLSIFFPYHAYTDACFCQSCN